MTDVPRLTKRVPRPGVRGRARLDRPLLLGQTLSPCRAEILVRANELTNDDRLVKVAGSHTHIGELVGEELQTARIRSTAEQRLVQTGYQVVAILFGRQERNDHIVAELGIHRRIGAGSVHSQIVYPVGGKRPGITPPRPGFMLIIIGLIMAVVCAFRRLLGPVPKDARRKCLSYC